ncbi:MAG: triose-phosphate isomerase [Bacteroidia bacterium]|nr:triose-phosphate isomerase [Bacteroidia bacterium]
MRKRLVAGNWKMNTNMQDGYRLLKDILDGVRENELQSCDVHVYAPFTHLKVFSNSLNGSGILLGAQNCHHEASGAYTGEVSAEMLASVPVGGVLLGHSERRQYFGETNEVVGQKVNQALENGLQVIYCFGETLEEREANTHFDVVERQIKEGLGHLTVEQWDNITLAYEPVWAIGTGKTATAEQAQEIHASARNLLGSMVNNEVAEKTRILYGGSVKPNNAGELFGMADIDGGLIGGAALNADSFKGIITA